MYNPSLEGMPAIDQAERVELVNDAFKLIKKNMHLSKEKHELVLELFELFDKKIIYYNAKVLRFEEFIDEVIKDTNNTGIFYRSTKIKTLSELKKIFVLLLGVIRNVVASEEISRDVKKFIKEEYGYQISNKDTINILNFLINYRMYNDFNTIELMDELYPEIIEKSVAGFKEADTKANALKDLIVSTSNIKDDKRSNGSRPGRDKEGGKEGGKEGAKSRRAMNGGRRRRNRTRKH